MRFPQFLHGFGIMVMLAQALQVRAVCEVFPVTAVRDDVINHHSLGADAFCRTFPAERFPQQLRWT